MVKAARREITRILQDWTAGDHSALDRLAPLVFHELHRLARHYMAGERYPVTLETAALVNEAFIRLVDVRQISWHDRAHFFAMTATLMRQILVDFARRRHSQKRGGDAQRIPVELVDEGALRARTDLVELDEALSALAQLDDRQSRVVELRFFGGLTVEETAVVLNISPGSVRRDWRLARAWLFRELSAGEASSEQTGPSQKGEETPE